MRKLVTREKRDRKETRKKIIIGLLLVGLMLISTAGYAFYNTEGGLEKIKYNGIKFILKETGLWHFYVQDYEFATTYNPEQTEDISFVINFDLQNYIGKPLYFSHDSDGRAVNAIGMNIGRFASRIQLVCMEECEEDLPIKGCDENIIIIQESSENLIKQEDSCIYILFRRGEEMRASDAFIFRVLEVQ